MDVNKIKKKFELLQPLLNERTERLFAAAEAMFLGRGGILRVESATGIERHRIGRGIRELQKKEHLDPNKIRNPGAGRKKVTENDPKLIENLEKLLEPHTRGDPENPLRWTTKSVRKLAKELVKNQCKISHQSVANILHELKYSLQANSKTNEGGTHPDRNAQFEYISERVSSQMKAGNPVISVDAKKKELVGNFKNNGREWRPKMSPEEVEVYDFLSKAIGKAAPYGIYDLAINKGWVNVGISKDTAQFAVESIRQWWKNMGKKDYPKVKRLLITADCGGSNGYRIRLWKWELQKFANEINIPISISHFPPGTSKWNKIEHKLFSFISKNWRAKPLISYETVINLISSTTTEKGLKVECKLDKKKYLTGIKISNKDFATINVKKESFHGEWNYTISPNN